jgi:hypothetical protein
MALDEAETARQGTDCPHQGIMRYTWDRADSRPPEPARGLYWDRITVWCQDCNEMLMQWIRDKGFSSWNRP